VFSVLQFPNNPMGSNVQEGWARAWRDEGRLLITYGALDAQRTLPLLTELLRGDAGVRTLLADSGYDAAPGLVAAAFLTDYALAANPTGICLFSAMTPVHLEALIARSGRAPDGERLLRLGAQLSTFLADPAGRASAA
jgi:hypothetical protein